MYQAASNTVGACLMTLLASPTPYMHPETTILHDFVSS